MGREIENELDRAKERRDTLLEIKLERGEIYPFIESFPLIARRPISVLFTYCLSDPLRDVATE